MCLFCFKTGAADNISLSHALSHAKKKAKQTNKIKKIIQPLKTFKLVSVISHIFPFNRPSRASTLMKTNNRRQEYIVCRPSKFFVCFLQTHSFYFFHCHFPRSLWSLNPEAQVQNWRIILLFSYWAVVSTETIHYLRDWKLRLSLFRWIIGKSSITPDGDIFHWLNALSFSFPLAHNTGRASLHWRQTLLTDACW